MCLKNRDFYSNAKYFSRSNMHRFVNNCNCGECEECLARKRSEWYLRMYWQARWIFDRPYNAYIVFDTLTYADEYLPKLSRYFEVGDDVNFSIVDYDDIQKFLKRLRMNLWRHYRVGKEHLKYYIASEYGDDKIYKDDYGREHKGTIRPHYHCLFYVDVDAKELSPLDFIKEVHYSWKNGNTDNYKTFKVRFPHYGKYVNNNIFGKGYARGTDKDLRQVTNYVSKYIRKSSEYENLVNSRVYKVFLDTIQNLPKYSEAGVYIDGLSDRENEWLNKFFRREHAPIIRMNYSEKDLYKFVQSEIKKKIRVFHKQSQGFGMYCIDCMSEADRDYMLRNGNLRIDDADSPSGKREIPIPMYYVRKLFYNYRVGSDGRVQWYLTENGLSCMKQMTYGKINRLAERYANWYVNLSKQTFLDAFSYESTDEQGNVTKQPIFEIDDIQQVHQMVQDLLDGRDFYDLATYALCYRGRILYQYHTKDDSMPTIDDILDMQNEYNIETSEKFFIKQDGKVEFFEEQDLPWLGKSTKKKYKDFYMMFCINEDTEFEGERRFRYFDMLLDIVRWTMMPKQAKKEEYSKHIVDLRERLKNYGFRTRE